METAAGYFTNLILSNEEGGKMLENLLDHLHQK